MNVTARRVGGACVFGFLLLLPSVSESAASLLSCTAVRLSPSVIAALDGGSPLPLTTEVAANASTSSNIASPAAYLASLQTISLLQSDTRFSCFAGSHAAAGNVAAATIVLCTIVAPLAFVIAFLRDARLAALRARRPASMKSSAGSAVVPDTSRSSNAVMPEGDTRPAAVPDSATAPAGTQSTHQGKPDFVADIHDALPVADPVVEALLGPYAPWAWPLALCDPAAAIVLGALEGSYPRPADLTGVLVKACVGATVVISLLAAVFVCRPFARGHEWKAPVRAALLVLALVCILNNLGAGLVQVGYAGSSAWQGVGVGLTFAAASISGVMLVGCWAWHVACIGLAIEIDSARQKAGRVQHLVPSSHKGWHSPPAFSPLMWHPVSLPPAGSPRPTPSSTVLTAGVASRVLPVSAVPVRALRKSRRPSFPRLAAEASLTHVPAAAVLQASVSPAHSPSALITGERSPGHRPGFVRALPSPRSIAPRVRPIATARADISHALPSPAASSSPPAFSASTGSDARGFSLGPSPFSSGLPIGALTVPQLRTHLMSEVAGKGLDTGARRMSSEAVVRALFAEESRRATRMGPDADRRGDDTTGRKSGASSATSTTHVTASHRTERRKLTVRITPSGAPSVSKAENDAHGDASHGVPLSTAPPEARDLLAPAGYSARREGEHVVGHPVEAQPMQEGAPPPQWLVAALSARAVSPLTITEQQALLSPTRSRAPAVPQPTAPALSASSRSRPPIMEPARHEDDPALPNAVVQSDQSEAELPPPPLPLPPLQQQSWVSDQRPEALEEITKRVASQQRHPFSSPELASAPWALVIQPPLKAMQWPDAAARGMSSSSARASDPRVHLSLAQQRALRFETSAGTARAAISGAHDARWGFASGAKGAETDRSRRAAVPVAPLSLSPSAGIGRVHATVPTESPDTIHPYPLARPHAAEGGVGDFELRSTARRVPPQGRSVAAAAGALAVSAPRSLHTDLPSAVGRRGVTDARGLSTGGPTRAVPNAIGAGVSRKRGAANPAASTLSPKRSPRRRPRNGYARADDTVLERLPSE